MYQKIKQLYGMKLRASDGDIGQVKDFYFDDQTWAVRYLIVETGSWLAERQVLLSPHAFENHSFGKSDTDSGVLLVNLTRKQIEDSPSLGHHRPVSRQYEDEYHSYYGWPTYWEAGGMWGIAGFPPSPPAEAPSDNMRHRGHNQPDDVHLRSTKAISGYKIQASDELIGHVTDFTVDGRTWAIREIVVETGHWYSRKEILLLPENVVRIMHEGTALFVNLTKEDIAETSRDDVAQAGAGHR
jgi:uncharacterized protein YrrD